MAKIKYFLYNNKSYMPKKPTIHFIMTGGTIDSFYNGTKDTATP